MSKCVFLDRDGVLNEEIGRYVWELEDFKIVEGIIPLLQHWKAQGYHLVVVTNQAGIAKQMYTHAHVSKLHSYFQEQCGHLIDHFYYSPYHPDFSESLLRKPDSLMFEKAIAKFGLDPSQCWMIGDKERDMIPAKKLGMKTVRLFLDQPKTETIADICYQEVKEIEKSLF